MDALIRGVDALEQTIAARRDTTAPPSIEQAVARARRPSLPEPGAASGAAPVADAAAAPRAPRGA